MNMSCRRPSRVRKSPLCSRSPSRISAICLAAGLLGCGLRVSEACALARSQLDLPNRLIYIAGRVVPIPRETVEAIEGWLAINDEPQVFPIKQRMVRILCEKYRERAGIPEQVTPSLLRHTSAVWQLVDGADPEQLKLQFGHEREDVMVHYISRASQLRTTRHAAGNRRRCSECCLTRQERTFPSGHSGDSGADLGRVSRTNIYWLQRANECHVNGNHRSLRSVRHIELGEDGTYMISYGSFG